MDHPLYHKTHHTIQEIQQHFQQLSSVGDTVPVENEILSKIAAVNAWGKILPISIVKSPCLIELVFQELRPTGCARVQGARGAAA